MTVLLPSLAAVGYGVSDFAGGLAARRQPGPGGLLRGQLIGLLLLLGALPLAPGRLAWSGAWCALGAGGAGTAGLLLTYRLMRDHPLSIVAPFTAVLAAGIPVAVGALAGERISVTGAVGAAVGLVAVTLVASGAVGRSGLRGTTRSGSLAGRLRAAALMVAAGAGFGGFFVLIAQAGGEQSGLLPLVVARIAAVTGVLAATALAGRTGGRPAAGLILVAGATDAAADVCFLLASRHGHLSISSVVTALYPAVTVLLAVGLLRERIGPRLGCGLGLSAVTLALIAW